MKTSVSVALFFLAMVTPACRQQSHSDRRVIDLSGVWDNPFESKLSEIATDLEYIPLETRPECLLKDAMQMRATVFRNCIIVNSGGMKLFNRQGGFIRSIGTVGKGPGEYLRSGSYYLDETTETVYILDSDQRKVVVYKLSGEFTGFFPVGPGAHDITADGSGNLGILYLGFRENPKDTTSRFEWLTRDGGHIRTIPLYPGREPDGGETWSIAARLQRTGGQVVFAEWPFDTVYSLRDDKVWEPRWILQPGKDRIPREVSLELSRWSAERHQYRSVLYNYESERYVFFDGEDKGKMGLILYDKALAKSFWTPDVMLPDSSTYELITNDLDGGLNTYSNWYNLLRDEQLTMLVSPSDLITRFNDPVSANRAGRPALREKLAELAGRVHEDGNPVLMIVKLKGMNAR
jgi:hypothetical protein